MKIKATLKKFFYETFRPRGRADYAEIFSRGSGGTEAVPYPWFYSRALLASLLLFSFLSLGYGLSGLNFFAPAFIGGLFADLAFVILLYEIYPGRDLRLALPVAVLFAGGVLSSAAAYLLYGIMNAQAPYAMQAWTAFVEETSKAVSIVAIIALAKNREPFVCLILGAAVGGGFSAFENMWYMYTEGFVYSDLSAAIAVALVRALGTPFSHAAWAGTFGWAISGKKPWKTLRPYAAYAFGYIMHFFVNFPLMDGFAGWKGYPISAVTGVLSVMLFIFLTVKSRRGSAGAEATDGVMRPAGRLPKIHLYYPEAEEFYPERRVDRHAFCANVAAALAAICLSAALFGPTCVFGGYQRYRYYAFDDFADCKALAQNGLDLSPDFGREYVPYPDLTRNYSFAFLEGELNYAVQREQSGEYFYRYRYGFNTYPVIGEYDGVFYISYYGKRVPAYRDGAGLDGFKPVFGEGSDRPVSMEKWELQTVYLEYGQSVYSSNTLYDVSSSGEVTVLHYFAVNPACVSVYVSESGKYMAVTQEATPVRMTESIVFTAVFAAAAIGFGTAYAVEKIKSRRYKNVE